MPPLLEAPELANSTPTPVGCIAFSPSVGCTGSWAWPAWNPAWHCLSDNTPNCRCPSSVRVLLSVRKALIMYRYWNKTGKEILEMACLPPSVGKPDTVCRWHPSVPFTLDVHSFPPVRPQSSYDSHRFWSLLLLVSPAQGKLATRAVYKRRKRDRLWEERGGAWDGVRWRRERAPRLNRPELSHRQGGCSIWSTACVRTVGWESGGGDGH